MHACADFSVGILSYMTENKPHIIKQQLIELRVSDATLAEPMQELLHDLLHGQLVHDMDEACNSVSRDGTSQRIELLEVDLGALSTDQFLDEIGERFPEAFRTALSDAVAQQDSLITLEQDVPYQGTHLELLSYFIRTGMLPWWVDKAASNVLTDAMEVVLRTRPASLRPMLIQFVAKAEWLVRLVRDFTDSQLVQMASVLVPAYNTFNEDYTATIREALPLLANALGLDKKQLRNDHWKAVLQTLHWSRFSATETAGYVQSVWLAAAELSGISVQKIAGAVDVSVAEAAKTVKLQPEVVQAIHDGMEKLRGQAGKTASGAGKKAAGQQPNTGSKSGTAEADLRQLLRELRRVVAAETAPDAYGIWVQRAKAVLQKLVEHPLMVKLRPSLQEMLTALENEAVPEAKALLAKTLSGTDETPAEPKTIRSTTQVPPAPASDLSDWQEQLLLLSKRLKTLVPAPTNTVEAAAHWRQILNMQAALMNMATAELSSVRELASLVAAALKGQPEASRMAEFPALVTALPMLQSTQLQLEKTELQRPQTVMLGLLLHASDALRKERDFVFELEDAELSRTLTTLLEQWHNLARNLLELPEVHELLVAPISRASDGDAQAVTGVDHAPQNTVDSAEQVAATVAKSSEDADSVSNADNDVSEVEGQAPTDGFNNKTHTEEADSSSIASIADLERLESGKPASDADVGQLQPEQAGPESESQKESSAAGEAPTPMLQKAPVLRDRLRNWMEESSSTEAALQAMTTRTATPAEEALASWADTVLQRIRLLRSWIVQLDPAAFLAPEQVAQTTSLWGALEAGWSALEKLLADPVATELEKDDRSSIVDAIAQYRTYVQELQGASWYLGDAAPVQDLPNEQLGGAAVEVGPEQAEQTTSAAVFSQLQQIGQKLPKLHQQSLVAVRLLEAIVGQSAGAEHAGFTAKARLTLEAVQALIMRIVGAESSSPLTLEEVNEIAVVTRMASAAWATAEGFISSVLSSEQKAESTYEAPAEQAEAAAETAPSATAAGSASDVSIVARTHQAQLGMVNVVQAYEEFVATVARMASLTSGQDGAAAIQKSASSAPSSEDKRALAADHRGKVERPEQPLSAEAETASPSAENEGTSTPTKTGHGQPLSSEIAHDDSSVSPAESEGVSEQQKEQPDGPTADNASQSTDALDGRLPVKDADAIPAQDAPQLASNSEEAPRGTDQQDADLPGINQAAAHDPASANARTNEDVAAQDTFKGKESTAPQAPLPGSDDTAPQTAGAHEDSKGIKAAEGIAKSAAETPGSLPEEPPAPDAESHFTPSQDNTETASPTTAAASSTAASAQNSTKDDSVASTEKSSTQTPSPTLPQGAEFTAESPTSDSANTATSENNDELLPDVSKQDPRWAAMRKRMLGTLDSVVPIMESVKGGELEAVFQLLSVYLQAFHKQLSEAFYGPDQRWSNDLRKIAAMIRPFKAGQLSSTDIEQSPAVTQALQALALPLNSLLEQLSAVQEYRPSRLRANGMGPAAAKKRLSGMLENIEREVERVKVALNQGTSGPSAIDTDFSNSDEIFVTNAGLVLVYPFLPRFFTKLGLLLEGQWVSDEAQEKAVFLLQELVGVPEDEVAEFQLPLNKLMCGLDIDAPIRMQWTITDEEREQAEGMLMAVIMNAPMMKKLSVGSFRRAYVQRQGMLTRLEENWKLTVQRETYDVVVDRLPWSFNTLKLSWTEKVVFVEW